MLTICPFCGTAGNVPADWRGKWIRCRQCREKFQAFEYLSEPVIVDPEPALLPAPASEGHDYVASGIFWLGSLTAFVAVVWWQIKINPDADRLIMSVLGAGLIAFIGALYFAPTIIAFLRGHRNAAPIMVINALLGWTALFWIVSLVWALTTDQEQKVIFVERPSHHS